ncbi:hypothetical protein PA598K_00082 [Paenibacillus sp. 598K]|nr:hypothetical protein PA598K_00082 [Paenibacillus sp. 598K]
MRIQQGLMLILQELILRYTQGESTSVTTETAEDIMVSVLYAMDAHLFGLGQPEQAIDCLKRMNIRDIYTQGVETVSRCFADTKQLYEEVSSTMLQVPIEAYHLTIDEALPVFLCKYGLIFHAHNTMASIDYPLAQDDMKLQGVFYMKQYLERLQLENTFCAKFDLQAILELLSHYGRMCRFDYRMELFNLFQLILNQSVFSTLCGGAPTELRISVAQYERLAHQFARFSEGEIRKAITSAMTIIQQDLALDHLLIAYMDDCKEELVQRVKHAAEHNSLDHVIVMERQAAASSMVISFDKADVMSSAQLRRLLDQIHSCASTEEKVKLMLQKVHSIHDYLDLLESECLYGDEYEALFRAFGEMELAILAKVVFYEELRSEPLLAVIAADPDDICSEWQHHFVRFLRHKDHEALRSLDSWVNELDYEQLSFN